MSILRRPQNGPVVPQNGDRMIDWMRPRRASWKKALTGLTVLSGGWTLTLDVRPAMTQTPYGLFRERVAMTAADARCRLFDAETASALAAGAAQARTAALRAGYAAEAVSASNRRQRAPAAVLATRSRKGP